MDELTILKTYLTVQSKTRVAIKSLQFLTKGDIPSNLKGLDNLLKSIELTLRALNDELQIIDLEILYDLNKDLSLNFR